jgi:hypothetical protein
MTVEEKMKEFEDKIRKQYELQEKTGCDTQETGHRKIISTAA